MTQPTPREVEIERIAEILRRRPADRLRGRADEAAFFYDAGLRATRDASPEPKRRRRGFTVEDNPFRTPATPDHTVVGEERPDEKLSREIAYGAALIRALRAMDIDVPAEEEIDAGITAMNLDALRLDWMREGYESAAALRHWLNENGSTNMDGDFCVNAAALAARLAIFDEGKE